jgi:hypothetical protein
MALVAVQNLRYAKGSNLPTVLDAHHPPKGLYALLMATVTLRFHYSGCHFSDLFGRLNLVSKCSSREHMLSLHHFCMRTFGTHYRFLLAMWTADKLECATCTEIG